MLIPESKVSLQEKDIEDYLFAHPQTVFVDGDPVKSWIKRQFRIPSGILDLLGITRRGQFVIVEVKNTAIESAALLQVCRYAFDLDRILEIMSYEWIEERPPVPKVQKVVIGRSIDEKVFREAEALGVSVTVFEVQLRLKTVGDIRWAQSVEEERYSQHEDIASDQDLVAAIQQYDQCLADTTSAPSRSTVILNGQTIPAPVEGGEL